MRFTGRLPMLNRSPRQLLIRALGCALLLVIAMGQAAMAQQPPGPSPVPSKEKRIALVIGNGDYQRAAHLDNARNDARDMCQMLKKLSFETFCYENLRTKRQMKDAVIRFSERLAAGNMVSLVFYAGHGMQVRGENYLIPTEVDLRTEADIDDEALNVNYLMTQLDNSRNSFNMVILDACRNNPFSRGWRGGGGRGLASIDAPMGSVIIFSTAPGREASDGVGRNSVFTKHLLNNMPQPGLPLEEMIKQVSREVTEESNKQGFNQTPWWNSSFTGKFCFAGCTDLSKEFDLARVKAEKERIEAEAARLQLEQAQRQQQQTETEAKARARQAELEARIKQLEAQNKSASPDTNANANSELAKTQNQLTSLREDRSKQDEIQRRQEAELDALKLRGAELERKAKEIEQMNRRLVELEKAKAESETQLQIERSRKRSNEPEPPRGTVVPPVM
jgi:uncharacterized caspase-like protein